MVYLQDNQNNENNLPGYMLDRLPDRLGRLVILQGRLVHGWMVRCIHLPSRVIHVVSLNINLF